MKVLLIILGVVVVAAIAVVAGCRILANRSTEATVALTAKIPGKIAVVYYSQSKVGNTATVAKWIAKHTGGELVPIETVEAYPDAYGETLKAAKKDMENGGTRAIKSVPPLDGYDVVFIGSPIWYGTYAPPVAEFFKTHSFAGKTVVPFCTHGGGGAGRYFVDVRKACPAATVKEGLTIRGSNQVERRLGTGVTVHHTEDDVVNWLNALFAATAASAATGDALDFQTDTFKTKEGKAVTITAIKHASLRIQYDGLEIQVDPVAKYAPETDYSRFPKADVILVTHEHFDHFDRDTIAALRKDGTEIVANPAVQKMLGFGTALANGESRVLAKGIKLDAVPAYNTTPGHTQFHPKGRDNGYVLTIDGLRIYIAGDTEDIPEMSALKDIDVAFLPCNQPYTMTPEQVAKAARTIKPKVLFPYHYSQTPIKQVADLLADSGIDVRIRNYQ
ncbi:MAG: MBL fold metallo-hydrolase [Kiritimatiellae bacterium]|nr:MBL fold metallo-hydrolase [Kiritimatiellia bacterium]MBQ2625998.1 MBL fold metallo-hydrolase [Kiritimatiellia bacterium]